MLTVPRFQRDVDPVVRGALNRVSTVFHRPHPHKNRSGRCCFDAEVSRRCRHQNGRIMTYKGYQATVELDEDAGLFHGEVINTRDVITFQGSTVAELKLAFRDSVDDYLEFCAARGEEPEKPFSGKFLIRVTPELHRQTMTEARRQGKSLNAYVVERLQPQLQQR